ncbi:MULTISPECIES: LuxR C-terminal-related transcriptional regulator [Myxococcus]|uniref:LuxR C-terminal-related transcriptional regulator n=1 Tax=Myxococcus TaxID=32 RepID=UPI001144E21D|nr:MULTISPECIES: LuxR C-terminal-related transcriptional regulator [Myxococcus]NOK01779.1 LuxR family transcriptional regulator [Myxococcus xanthus]
MDASFRFSSREYQLMSKIAVALNESLILPDMLGRARSLLTQLIPADYTGLCIVTPGQPVAYEWIDEAGAPNALLAQYAELQPDDFVLKSVVRKRDTVLRDSEMLPRKKLETSPLYLRSCELGLKLEQVMATLMTVPDGVFGGFTMYRDKRRPFSRKARAALQFLSPSFVTAIRNSRRIASALTGDRLLEALSRRQNFEFLVVAPPTFETLRSERATTMVEKWFSKSERTRAGTPQPLLDHLRGLLQMDVLARPRNDTFERTRGDESLLVTYIDLSAHGSPGHWALLLYEFPESIPLPINLAVHLTPGQIRVAQAVLRNWENERIASELKISRHTVRTHIRDMHDRLGCSERADFMYQVTRFLRPI